MMLPRSVEVWNTVRDPRGMQTRGQDEPSWRDLRQREVHAAVLQLATVLFPGADATDWAKQLAANASLPAADLQFTGQEDKSNRAPFRPPFYLQRRDQGLGECKLWNIYFPYQKQVRRRSSEQLIRLMDESVYSDSLTPLISQFHRWRDDVLAWCRADAEKKDASTARLSAGAAVVAEPPAVDADEDAEMETEVHELKKEALEHRMAQTRGQSSVPAGYTSPWVQMTERTNLAWDLLPTAVPGPYWHDAAVPLAGRTQRSRNESAAAASSSSSSNGPSDMELDFVDELRDRRVVHSVRSLE